MGNKLKFVFVIVWLSTICMYCSFFKMEILEHVPNMDRKDATEEKFDVRRCHLGVSGRTSRGQVGKRPIDREVDFSFNK